MNEKIKEKILELDKVQETEHDFEKFGDHWYGSLGFEFRSDSPVEMINLFRQERDEDVIYYKSGEKLEDKKYKFKFIVQDEEVQLQKRRVGGFGDFEKELYSLKKELPEISEVDDGFIFEEEDFEDFLFNVKEKLIDPEVPVSVNYLMPDSFTANDEGEMKVDGVSIKSNVYVREQEEDIYELIPPKDNE